MHRIFVFAICICNCFSFAMMNQEGNTFILNFSGKTASQLIEQAEDKKAKLVKLESVVSPEFAKRGLFADSIYGPVAKYSNYAFSDSLIYCEKIIVDYSIFATYKNKSGSTVEFQFCIPSVQYYEDFADYSSHIFYSLESRGVTKIKIGLSESTAEYKNVDFIGSVSSFANFANVVDSLSGENIKLHSIDENADEVKFSIQSIDSENSVPCVIKQFQNMFWQAFFLSYDNYDEMCKSMISPLLKQGICFIKRAYKKNSSKYIDSIELDNDMDFSGTVRLLRVNKTEITKKKIKYTFRDCGIIKGRMI